MKQLIFNNWNFIRLVRLGLGIFIIGQAVLATNWNMGLLGLLLTLMPLFNIGCCGINTCAAPGSKTSEATKDIKFEELV